MYLYISPLNGDLWEFQVGKEGEKMTKSSQNWKK